ncbi:MAG: butyrate kinase [Bacteroidales bacterium]|nr:butyrate kinase [Bacteroidales bacterium]MCF8403942.1 butyrate kinase [Bacteroidales bacterium]
MDNLPGILAINPGSTSTKIAVYKGETPIFLKNIKHSNSDLAPFEKITDQFQFRKKLVMDQMTDADIAPESLKIIMGRGGLLKPIQSGIYEVNSAMLKDLRNSPLGEHASNLGGLIAHDIALSLPGARAYIANPVVVDEMIDLARYSGHPYFKRKSIFHALNQKAVAHEHAKSILKKYEDLNLIVAHLGGGITVGAHRKGKVIDVNQGLDGEGPFSPERSGTLPAGDLVRLCFSGKMTQKEIMLMIKGNGGLAAYAGTNSAYEVEMKAFEGDEKSSQQMQAMAYQVSKDIGAAATVLEGNVDGILITGGVANSKWFVDLIIDRVKFIAPVHVYPGEDEMRALAFNGLQLLKGEAISKIYE